MNHTIFCLYLSKGCDFSQVVQSLKNYGFDNLNENTYLIGDFNFDVSGCNDLTRYLTSINYIQIVKRATHLDGHILDQVYVQETKARRIEIQHHHPYYSDHNGVLVSLKKDVM